MFYENCFPYSQPQNVDLSTTLPSPNMTYDLSTEIACQNNTQQLELEPEPDTSNQPASPPSPHYTSPSPPHSPFSPSWHSPSSLSDIIKRQQSTMIFTQHSH